MTARTAATGERSALPWILGAIGLFAVLGVIGFVVLVAVSGDSEPDPSPVTSAKVSGPKLESTAIATSSAVDAAPPPPPKVVRTSVPPPPPSIVPVRPSPPPTAPPSVPVIPAATVALPVPFPRAQAQAEVDRVAGTLASCKRPEGPFGQGSIRVDFEPDGRVGTLSRPPFSGTPVGNCISARFLAIRVGKFDGGTQRIEKTFIIQD